MLMLISVKTKTKTKLKIKTKIKTQDLPNLILMINYKKTYVNTNQNKKPDLDKISFIKLFKS